MAVRLNPAKHMIRLSFAMLGTFAVVGCGDNRPRTVTVKTKVIVNGAPATGADVTLHPVQSEWQKNWNHRPFGKVREDGTVSFSTFRPSDGVPPGKYIVTILWANSEGENDRLRGEHSSPERSQPITATIGDSATEIPTIELRTCP